MGLEHTAAKAKGGLKIATFTVQLVKVKICIYKEGKPIIYVS
jgi:hypothetical protein